MKSKTALIGRAVLILGLASLCIPQSCWAQKEVEKVVANSAAFDGNTLDVKLQYPDPNNPGKVTSTAVPVKVEPWNPKKELQITAQKRKVDAIATAINKANLNGGKVKATPLDRDPTTGKKYTIPLCTLNPRVCYWKNPITGQPFYGWRIKVEGLAIGPNNKENELYVFLNDKTGEASGGAPPWKPKDPPPKIPPTGSMDGTRSGMSTGVAPSGGPSVFSFGLHSDEDGTDYVATLVGAVGMTDSEILSELASEFNSVCGKCGYTAYYDPTGDKLTFYEPLQPDMVFITIHTDTGIQFDTELGAELSVADTGTAP
jgi:hypothetical protein